jgi:type IV pilus assembly protein PilA
MAQHMSNRKGFTLVELMIVVAIIGILAAIAIPNFLNFRLKAKTSEAKSNLGAIRSTEVAYFAEWNWYVGGQTPVPMVNRGTNANGEGKAPWDGTGISDASGVTSRFSILGFAPEGNVFFSYSLDGVADSFDLNGFTGHAIGDLDGDGQTSDFSVTNYLTEITKAGAPF